MKLRFTILYLLVLRFNVLAQTATDSTSFVLQQDTTLSILRPDSISTQSKLDSFIIVTPIPEIGTIEPFGDSSTITRDIDITWHEYRSLYDILSHLHGISIRDLASPGQENQIMTSGLTDRNIVIFVDGIPYNDYYTGSYNLWMIPVDAIEKIEYVSGAGGLFFDGKSSGGTINIVTKNYYNNRAITNLRYSQGVFGYVNTDAFFAQNIFRNVNLTLGLSHYGYGTNKASSFYRGRFHNSNDDAWTFRAKLRYNLTNWINFSFFYLQSKTFTGLHGGIDYLNTESIFDDLKAKVENEDSYEKYSNSHYTFTTSFYPTEDSTLLATLSFFSLDRLREYRDEENRQNPNGIFLARDFSSKTNGVKFQFKSMFEFNSINFYTTYENIKSQDIVTVGIKDEILLIPYLSITPFLTTGNSSENSAGVLSEITLSQMLKLFCGISQSVTNDFYSLRSPYQLQLLGAVSGEKYSSKEFGIEFNDHNYFRSKLSFQNISQKHPIIFDTIQLANPSSFILKDEYTYNSISASAHLILGEFHLEGKGNYIKQPTMIRNNVKLILFPELTLDGSVYYHGLLANGNLDLKIGLRGQYFSKQTGMKPYNEFGVWIPSSLLSYGPSGTIDFFAIGKIGSAYVHLIWENLADNQYLLAPVYPMYSRNIRFGLSWEFLD